MAVLSANARKHIAPHNFALPGGRYPIEDEDHARDALARVAQNGSPEEKARVRAAVHAKFPHIVQEHDEKMAHGGMAHRKPHMSMDAHEISRRIREKKAALVEPEDAPQMPDAEEGETPMAEGGMLPEDDGVQEPEMGEMSGAPEEDEKEKKFARIRKSLAKAHR